MSRFSQAEEEQLAALARTVEWSREHLARAEELAVDLLPLDAYEASIVADYRSQMRAVALAFEELLDLRLERSPDADRKGRDVADAYELLAAMQSEMARIIDKYYERYLAGVL